MPDPIPGNRLPRYDDDATILLKGRELNQLATRIEEGRPIPGPGLEARGTPDGVELRAGAFLPDYAPFAVIKTEANGANYDVTFSPGRVVIPNPAQFANGGDGYDYHIPEIDGVPMDELDTNDEFPKLTVSPGQGVYCSISRDEKGQITGSVEIITSTIAADSQHYQPADPDSSGLASNTDLIRIIDLTEDGDLLVLKVWRKSDILLAPFLWTGENVGANARVFRNYEQPDGTYNFRTLKGCWGSSVAEDGDIIKIEADAVNIGAGAGISTGEGAELLVEKDAETAPDLCEESLKIRVLLQGSAADEKQIRITQDGEVARIHGNGINGRRVFKDCLGAEITRIEWEDGLITTSGNADIIVGECYTYT